MARNLGVLPEGSRLSDYMGVGVVVRTFPYGLVRAVLDQSGRQTRRRRDLPANVMLYFVIVTALYAKSSSREVLRCVVEGLHWLSEPPLAAGGGPKGAKVAKLAGKSGISQARARLGLDPVRRLHDQVVRPIATAQTRRAWYRGWRLVSLDGATLDVGQDPENLRTFGGPGSPGPGRRPRIRFASLVETGTHVLFGSRMGPHAHRDASLAGDVVGQLGDGMLCLAGPRFFDVGLWMKARRRGAELVWRAADAAAVEGASLLPDGSYLAHWSGMEDGRPVRLIDCPAKSGDGGRGPLVTSLIDPQMAVAGDLITAYRERAEAERALDKLRLAVNRSGIVLRSKSPDLVCQEFYAMMMAHFALRNLIHEVDDGNGDLAGDIAPLVADYLLAAAGAGEERDRDICAQ